MAIIQKVFRTTTAAAYVANKAAGNIYGSCFVKPAFSRKKAPNQTVIERGGEFFFSYMDKDGNCAESEPMAGNTLLDVWEYFDTKPAPVDSFAKQQQLAAHTLLMRLKAN